MLNLYPLCLTMAKTTHSSSASKDGPPLDASETPPTKKAKKLSASQAKPSSGGSPKKDTPDLKNPSPAESPADNGAHVINPSHFRAKNFSAAFATSQKIAKSASVPSTNSRSCKIKSCRTSAGDMVAICTSHDGSGAWLGPLVAFCKDPCHSDFVVGKCKIHHTSYLVNKKDPFKYQQTNTTSNFKLSSPVFVSFFPEAAAHKNTLETRRTFCQNICRINNSAAVQCRYKYQTSGTILEYSGDVTPQDLLECPKLCEFLSIDDVWTCIKKMTRDPQTEMELPNEDLLQDADLLLQFYNEELLPRVRTHFGPREVAAAAEEEEISLEPVF